MGFTRQHNIGAYIHVDRAAANTAVTAAGSGDNTAVTGAIVDRVAKNYANSCVAAIPFTTTLGQAQTLTLKNVLIEHGDDSGLSDAATFATMEDSTGTVVSTGGTGGTTNTGCSQYSVDLVGAKRYIRLKFTPDINTANTDTAALSAVFVFGGEDTLPSA